MEAALRQRGRPAPRRWRSVIDGEEVHLAVAVTSFEGPTRREGTVIVLDDVTPLIRAQKVAAWRDVARRLAHEVKNPLTPIQLSAERLRRHFTTGAGTHARRSSTSAPRPSSREVESLKLLVDEFSQFARMPAPRTVPADVNRLLEDALHLYGPAFSGIRIERRFASDAAARARRRRSSSAGSSSTSWTTRSRRLPARRPADGRDARSSSRSTSRRMGIVRVVVADNGPGIPEGDRQKLFLPYYSTKRRGSGLGLAIVRRIIVEHGGQIEAAPNDAARDANDDRAALLTPLRDL